jgi:hypothetical protein
LNSSEPVPPLWVRVGALSIDTRSGRYIVDDGDDGQLSDVERETLVALVTAGSKGITALALARDEAGAPARSVAKRAAAAQTRIRRLRVALGESAAQLTTLPEGRYRLHFTEDTPRGTRAATEERLHAAVLGALAAAGWTLNASHASLGDRSLPLDVLLGAPAWLEESSTLRFLPPLLGADRPVPLATVYVELRMASGSGGYDPALLGRTRSLAEAVSERRRRRDARARTIHEVLGPGQAGRLVLLGDPGSGKSSLLRRVALDVVTGRLPRWSIPVLVDLPTWWSVRARVGHACDIETFGAACLLARACGPGALSGAEWERLAGRARAVAEALGAVGGGRGGVIFLCDGLDELVNLPGAVAVAQESIRALYRRHAAIVASRPAGFPGGLGEDARYTLCDLDLDGIEALVDAWFRHHQDDPEPDTDKARALAIQLRSNPRLLDMARNPFLLTLLCHLTATGEPPPRPAAPAPDPASGDPWSGSRVRSRAARRREQAPPLHELPLLRAQIYEAILSLAHVQAQVREPGCFDVPARQRLGGLCTALQLGPDGPRHFFEAGEWAVLFPDAPPFERSVLPARIVSRWSETGRYHLAHLTFHEFFVARTLIDGGRLAEILDRVFRPGWSMIVRFAAGILASRGRMDDVAMIVRALLDPGELLGRADIDAAAILVEAGVTDSTGLLGYDLRERLWGVFAQGRPLLEEAAAEGLGVLDARWAYTRCKAVMDAEVHLPDADASESSLVVVRGYDVRAQRALHLLGAIPYVPAEEELMCRVLDAARPTVEGILAATVLADHDRRHIRARLARAVSVGASRAVVGRFATYASRAPHRDLVPAILAGLAVAPGRSHELELLDALLATGVAEAWEAAFAWVAVDRPDRAADFAGILAASLRLVVGGSLHEKGRDWLLELAADRGLDPELRAVAYAELVRARESGPELISRLERAEDPRTLLEAITDAGESGGVFAAELDERLERLGGEAPRRALHAVQIGRWLMDDPRFRRECLVDDLAARSRGVRASAYMALGTVEALDLLPVLLDRAETAVRGEEAMALVGAIGLLAPTRLTRAAPRLEPELHARVVGKLEAWLDASRDSDLRQQAADGLAFWDFGRAGLRLGNRDVRTALARACAETGRLAFEKGWIDTQGDWHTWG